MNVQILLKGHNFLFFGLLALFIPFLPVFLKGQGLSTSDVGLIIGAGGFVTIIAQPLWGMISDKTKTLRKVMLFLIFTTAISGFILFNMSSFWGLVIIAMLVYFFLMPLDPLTESLNYTMTEAAGTSYGSVRTYGALGYAVLSLVVGYVMKWFGMNSISILFVILGIICFIIMWKLPDAPTSSTPVTIDGLKKLLTNKEMILFLLLIFTSSIPARMNDTFLGIHIDALGGDTSLVGIAFFISAASEIVVFALSYLWLRQGKELLIITIAIFCYALRFFLSGLVDSPVLLAIIQTLQMLTFPIYYTAAIQYLYQIVPREWRATGQTVLALLFFGISGIISSSVGGFLYNVFGGHVFYYTISAISFFSGIFGFILLIQHSKKTSIS
ncbi:MFS transporter [Rummeliibacillus sp. TYF005]|uniref:MFS transporter n=1 Tax=unclassified Rummeliibacillus TaxID=2622809 RepID=UPI000E660302|nr:MULTISPECIES: MFS transporter [unclassified Rummeliibacillus]RIJ68800.1 MFS transporter [Rummeliibacillus sp. POC4]RPJ94516.1 MFS transporter [Rummeliibacillus sp. TYF005]